MKKDLRTCLSITYLKIMYLKNMLKFQQLFSERDTSCEIFLDLSSFLKIFEEGSVEEERSVGVWCWLSSCCVLLRCVALCLVIFLSRDCVVP